MAFSARSGKFRPRRLAGRAFATLFRVPLFAANELLSVIRAEHGERERRLAELLRESGLDASRAGALDGRVGELLARARAKSPLPDDETLALGVLSLIALETRS
jgi:hypothetical protein